MMTVSQLAMLTVVAVASLRSLPAMADYGLASILLYLIPAVVFLVPTALVAAGRTGHRLERWRVRVGA